MPKPTDEQQRAIDNIDCNVSVSAGAGSGKTAVLKARFLHILEAGRTRGIKASNILGITFTRKAANEIKSRIREAMLEAMHVGDEAFWEEQLRELEKAQISTIHGLCSRILKDNPVEANLDPSFLVAEEGDYDAFKTQCVWDFLREKLAQAGDNSVKALADELGTGTLAKYLLDLSKNFNQILKEKDLARPYRENAGKLKCYVNDLKIDLKGIIACKNRLGPKTATYRKVQVLEDSWFDIETELAQDPPCFNTFNEAFTLNGRDGQVKEMVYCIRDHLGKIDSSLVDARAIPLMEHWQKLIDGLNKYLQERKAQENLVTYDDLEDRAIELLQNYPELRHKYQKKFMYLMVDEFQDTNEKQRKLIYLLCGDDSEKLQGKKLFIVGDPKQSIYRFRGADVDVFQAVQDEIKATGGLNISLTMNFRSNDKILAACNQSFSQLMGDIANDPVIYEALAVCDAKNDYPVKPELTKIKNEGKTVSEVYQLEARAMAEKILALAEDTRTSPDYQEGEKIFGQMAVLLRSMNRVNDLAQVLADYGIPYTVIDGKGFYERQEVIDIINLFDVILNPYQNIPLAAVLKSPYFALDDESLSRLCLSDKFIWDALQKLNENSAGSTTQAKLLMRAKNVLLELVNSLSLLEIGAAFAKAWNILEVEAVQSLQKNGKQKLANVKKLRQLALEYSRKNMADLGTWLAYIKDARARGLKETNANLDAADAVQIMTIHKSKGLEFKKVFLPYLGARTRSNEDSIVYAPLLGLGIQLEGEKGSKEKTSVFTNIKDFEKEQDNHERKRILYVAMTRAEDELYMFGSPAKTIHENQDEDKWFDQLWNLYEDFDGVICHAIGDEDLKLTPANSTPREKFLVDEVTKAQLAPLPSFASSGRKIFTPSALSTYIYCQRQYFYANVMGLPGVDESLKIGTGDMDAATMGTIIHEALENYTGDDLEAVFQAALKNWAPSSKGDRAWNILTGYVNSELFKSIPPKHLREHEFFVPGPDENLIFTGIIDVLAENADGSLAIIDYKTGQPHEDEKEILGYQYQLAIYKYAAEKIFGKKVSSTALHFLQNQTKWDKVRENAFDEAVALAKEIAAKTREEEFTCNLESCKHCQYNYLCTKK